MADKTFNVDETLLTNVIRNKIEKNNILNLTQEENVYTYVIALSLGVNNNKRVKSKNSKGFLRLSAIENSPEMSFIYSVALNELRKDGRDNQIEDIDVVRKIIEEYVNGGLEVIDGLIDENYNCETFVLNIISEMDDVFGEIGKKE